MTTKKYGWLMKISLLSISLLLLSGGAISGIIPAMAETFPDVEQSSIEMVLTLPLITLVIALVFSIFLTRWIGAKKTVLLGLVIAFAGGMLPLFLNNFMGILVARGIFGFGMGLFNSLSFSMISNFFEGSERNAMLGYQSACQGAGGAVLTLAAGQLARSGWHFAFLIYLAFIPIFILFLLFVPEPPKAPQTRGSSQYRLAPALYSILLLNFLGSLVYNTGMIKIPSLVVERGYGTAPTSSFMLFFVLVASTLTGLVFGKVYEALKNRTLLVGFLLFTVAFFLISLVSNQAIMAIGTVLMGAAFSLTFPYIFAVTAQRSTPASQAFATTVVIIVGQVAGFLCPFIMDFLGSVQILSNPFAQSILWAALISALTACLVFFLERKAG